MSDEGHGRVEDLRAYHDAPAALARISEIYKAGTRAIRQAWDGLASGAGPGSPQAAFYPYVGITVEPQDISKSPPLAYGHLSAAGTYGTTVTRPGLFKTYYLEQLELLLRDHGKPVMVGVSDRPIPLTFVIEEATDIDADQIQDLQSIYPLPDLSRIDDRIPNGFYAPDVDGPKPLALFNAERVDLSLVRLSHYTAILIGATPAATPELNAECRAHADRAARLAGLSGEHANAGLRAYYFGMAALGWLLHPFLLMATGTLVVMVLYRREYRSRARDVVAMP